MSQMSHLKQKNGKVLETLLLSPGKTENPRYVLPPRGRRQADTPTIDTTVVRQRLTLRRGVRTRFIASAHSEAKRSAYRCFVGACTLRLAPTRAHPPPNPTPCHYMSPGPTPRYRLVGGWRPPKCSGTGWLGGRGGPSWVPGLTAHRSMHGRLKLSGTEAPRGGGFSTDRFFEHGNIRDIRDIGDIGDKCPNGDIGDKYCSTLRSAQP